MGLPCVAQPLLRPADDYAPPGSPAEHSQEPLQVQQQPRAWRQPLWSENGGRGPRGAAARRRSPRAAADGLPRCPRRVRRQLGHLLPGLLVQLRAVWADDGGGRPRGGQVRLMKGLPVPLPLPCRCAEHPAAELAPARPRPTSSASLRAPLHTRPRCPCSCVGPACAFFWLPAVGASIVQLLIGGAIAVAGAATPPDLATACLVASTSVAAMAARAAYAAPRRRKLREQEGLPAEPQGWSDFTVWLALPCLAVCQEAAQVAPRKAVRRAAAAAAAAALVPPLPQSMK